MPAVGSATDCYCSFAADFGLLPFLAEVTIEHSDFSVAIRFVVKGSSSSKVVDFVNRT